MILTLQNLIDRAPDRSPGYVEYVCSRGEVVGNEVHLDDEVYRELQKEFGTFSPGCCGQST